MEVSLVRPLFVFSFMGLEIRNSSFSYDNTLLEEINNPEIKCQFLNQRKMNPQLELASLWFPPISSSFEVCDGKRGVLKWGISWCVSEKMEEVNRSCIVKYEWFLIPFIIRVWMESDAVQEYRSFLSYLPRFSKSGKANNRKISYLLLSEREMGLWLTRLMKEMSSCTSIWSRLEYTWWRT